MMSERDEYIKAISTAIEGVRNDAQVILQESENTESSMRDALDRKREAVNGNIQISTTDLIALQTSAAMGAAIDANNSLENGDILQAAMLALLGQKLISSTTGYMLGMEIGKAIDVPARTYFKEIGKSGAIAKHKPMEKLKSWAVALYKPNEWRSANAAAHSMARKVIDHGRTIGAFLSEENAQRTIAEWFRKSV